jgi:hypothetical protein
MDGIRSGVWRPEVAHELTAHRVVAGRVGHQHAAVFGLGGFCGLEFGVALPEQPGRAAADV